jgi:DNA-binding response OmpR family regulator
LGNHVLVAESDPVLRSSVVRDLAAAGFVARSCGTGLEVLHQISTDPPDAVVLELPSDELGQEQVVSMIRAVSQVPLLVAGTFGSEAQLIRLIELGADDVVGRPSSFEHLLARLTAVLRRCRTGPVAQVHTVGGLVVDVVRREVTLDGVPLALSRREFELLAHLAAWPGEVVTRRELMREVWRLSYGDEQTVHVHLSWLRRKLGESATQPRYLHTVRGVGVKLEWTGQQAGTRVGTSGATPAG